VAECISDSFSLTEYCERLKKSFENDELSDYDLSCIDVKFRVDVIVYFWSRIGLSEFYLLFAKNHDFNEIIKDDRAFSVIAKNMFKRDNAIIICTLIINTSVPTVLDHNKSIYILHFFSRLKDISKNGFLDFKQTRMRVSKIDSSGNRVKLLAADPTSLVKRNNKSKKKFPYYGVLNRDTADGAPWRRITKDMIFSGDRVSAIYYIHFWSKTVDYKIQKAVASFFEDYREIEPSFFSITVVTEVFESHATRKEAIQDLESMPLEWRAAIN